MRLRILLKRVNYFFMFFVVKDLGNWISILFFGEVRFFIFVIEFVVFENRCEVFLKLVLDD